MTFRRTILLIAAFAIAPPVRGADVREAFEVDVPEAPVPVAVDGRAELVYEIHLTNFASEALTIEAVAVVDAATKKPIRDFRGEALAKRFALVHGEADATRVDAGRRGVVFVELDVPGDAVPAALEHRIAYSDGASQATLEGPRIAVVRGAPLSLGPPLKGGPWVAVHSPDWPRGHRRVVYAVDGRARIPGRFAIDWVRVDENGRAANGDADVPVHALGYGADVLAVADARVAAVRDGMAESGSVAGNPKHAIGDASGNYVALDLGGGRYAFYEHLEPGSVRVRAGDAVERGQVIGALGFTGDTTGPHLHFHVADGDTPLGAEGVPFVLDRFTALGRYEDIARLGSAPWTPRPENEAAARERERPLPNEVVMF